MPQQLQVLLISNNQYVTGVLQGYFRALGGHLIHITDNHMLSDTLTSSIPDIVFLDFNLNKWFPSEKMLKALMQIIYRKNILICGLSGVGASSEIKQSLNIEFDNILTEPIDITQLDNYIFEKFNYRVSFFNSRAKRDRRNGSDRRSLMSSRRLDDAEQQEKLEQNNIEKLEISVNSVGPFLVDNKLKCVYFKDKLIPLTHKEFQLFNKLACEVDRVVSDVEIIEYLWPGNNHATKADLHQYMHLLRKKIESDPKKPQWITTVKGFGYRLLV